MHLHWMKMFSPQGGCEPFCRCKPVHLQKDPTRNKLDLDTEVLILMFNSCGSFCDYSSYYFKSNKPKDLDVMITLDLKSPGSSVTAVQNFRIENQLLF